MFGKKSFTRSAMWKGTLWRCKIHLQNQRFGLFQRTPARVPKHDGSMLGCLKQSVVSDRQVLDGQFLFTSKQVEQRGLDLWLWHPHFRNGTIPPDILALYFWVVLECRGLIKTLGSSNTVLTRDLKKIFSWLFVSN